MPKHKAKKKNLKKRVHRKVQKLKEITAEDLLMNPALLYSPQFKALPLEKQFQLTTQLKQLKTYGMRPMAGVGAVSSSNADAIYSKYLDSNSKLQQAQNETQKLKQQIEENERQKALEMKLQNELKDKEHRYNKTMKHNNAINDLQRQMDKLDEQFDIDQINDLKTRAGQILDSQEQQKAQKRRDEWQKQSEEFMNNIAQMPNIDYEKALEYYELSAIENQKRNNRAISKLVKNQQELNEMNEKRNILQKVSNIYNESGESEKAEYIEQQILDMNDDISQKKTAPITDMNDDYDEFTSDESVDLHNEQNSQEDISFNPNESIEQQNITFEAQKMILQDRIKEAEEELKSKIELQQAEERANLTKKQNEQQRLIQNRISRRQLAERFDKLHNHEMLGDIVEAENLKNSTTLKPFVIERQNKLKELGGQYRSEKDSDKKLKIMIEMNRLNDEIKQEIDHWKSQQSAIVKQAQHLEDLQTQNGIQPNSNYRISLVNESKKSSPTKNNTILAKIENDKKQVEQGINELNEIKKLRKSAYDLTNQLQLNLIKNRAKNPGNISFVWKYIIKQVGDSKPKLQYIINDLTEESKKAELNQNITQIKSPDYLKKLESFNEDKINVAQPNEQLLFEGDDSWINDIKPNDKFDFELKDIKISPNAKTSQVFESVFGRILKEGAKWSWNHKWTRYLLIGTGIILAVRFMPEGTGEFLGNVAGKLSIGLGKIFGNQAHQIKDFSKGYYDAIKPGIDEAKEIITPYIQSGINIADKTFRSAYNQITSTEGGQLTIDTLNNVKNLAVDGINLAATTAKTASRVANSAAPIAEKGLNVLDFTLDKGGKAISWTVNGVNHALDWGKLGATKVGNAIYSAFKWIY